MDLIQNVGHAYLERKAHQAPQMLEGLAKKQFMKSHEPDSVKQQSKNTFTRPHENGKGEVVHHGKMDPETNAVGKDAEIARLKSQLDHFSFEREQKASQQSRKPSHHSPPSEAGSQRTKATRVSRSEERAPSVASKHTATKKSMANGTQAPSYVRFHESDHEHVKAPSKASHSHAPQAVPHAPSHHESVAKSKVSAASTLRGSGRIPSTSNEIIERSIAASVANSHHSPSRAPSEAHSYHTSHARSRSSHAGTARDLDRGSPPSHAASLRSHHTFHVPSHAPSMAPSHHTSRSRARSAHGSTVRGGPELIHSEIVPSRVPTHRSHAPSHHSHHSSHSKHTAKASRHARDDVSIAPSSSISNRDSSDSDSDGPTEHGGSAALLHQRQKYKRRCSLGVVPEIPPFEEREECAGHGFKPCRCPAPEYAEVFEEKEAPVLAPHVKEVRREQRYSPDHTSVVEISREREGRRLYKVK